jgi:hypothetical protein
MPPRHCCCQLCRYRINAAKSCRNPSSMPPSRAATPHQCRQVVPPPLINAANYAANYAATPHQCRQVVPPPLINAANYAATPHQ